MNVWLVVAPQIFRDEELFETRSALERAGHVVVIASSAAGLCLGAAGATVTATLGLRDARGAGFDALVFVGGGGARTFFDDPEAHRLAREMSAQGKIVGAIGIAPVILAKAGLLADERATVFPTEGVELTQAGAWLSFDQVMVDGNVITANGPAASAAFGARLVSMLELRKAA